MAALVLGLALLAVLADDPSDASDALKLSEPIACRSIKGYEDYVALDEPELTKDEKLFIYIRPLNHSYHLADDRYNVHLTEDVKIRRKGQKKVVWSRQNVLDYKADSAEPPLQLYLGTSIGLKQFPRGEYTAEFIVRDKLRPDDDADAVASETLTFRVVGKKSGGP